MMADHRPAGNLMQHQLDLLFFFRQKARQFFITASGRLNREQLIRLDRVVSGGMVNVSDLQGTVDPFENEGNALADTEQNARIDRFQLTRYLAQIAVVCQFPGNVTFVPHSTMHENVFLVPEMPGNSVEPFRFLFLARAQPDDIRREKRNEIIDVIVSKITAKHRRCQILDFLFFIQIHIRRFLSR